MNTQNIFDPLFRQEYMEGYENGLNPFAKNSNKGKSDAYNFGFTSGRKSYEDRNGSLSDGIPHLIVCERVLEEFLLAGLLGLKIDTYGYTQHQLNVLSKWYQSGIEKYDVKEGLYLIEILEEIGIELGE